MRNLLQSQYTVAGALDSSSLESSYVLYSQLSPMFCSHIAWTEAAEALMNVSRDIWHPGLSFESDDSTARLLSSKGSSALRASWNTSSCLSLWLLCRIKYPQMFCHQKSSILPISLRHLGLTRHCQGRHFTINYILFSLQHINSPVAKKKKKFPIPALIIHISPRRK